VSFYKEEREREKERDREEQGASIAKKNYRIPSLPTPVLTHFINTNNTVFSVARCEAVINYNVLIISWINFLSMA
jgi:hypothetical protein